ncbi:MULTISPECIES: DedA family protein [Nocardioides]|uniref:DedA family protein n=1 Tax=Nocardioides TaxID=1839 RepID=UPI00187A28B2|nr:MULTISPECIES: DedA family protein [Nocardioides]MCM3516981.1 DedA family protein [Nocardioides sp. P86]
MPLTPLTAVLSASDATGADLTGFAGWAVDVMERLGVVGAGALIALENLFPPLPSEIVLPLAGFTASRGDFGLVEAIVWTTVGSVLGALVLYGLGAVFGRDRVFRLWKMLPLVDENDFLRTEAWFGRHGRKAVFFGRMVPIFRSLISIPAGVERMPLWQFLALTTLGSLIWNSVFVVAGFQLGEQWQEVEPVVAYLQYAVIAAVALFVAWFVIRKVRGRRVSAG